MRLVVRVAAAVVLLAVAVGCQSREPVESALLASALPAGEPTYEGPVLEVDRARTRFLIQYRPVGASTGRVWIGVRTDTRLQRADGSAIAAADVRPGMTLSVWTVQPLMESDPAQTTGDTIVVRAAR